MLDFSANLFVLSVTALVVSVANGYMVSNWPTAAVIALPVIGTIYAWIALPHGAHQWGEVVKSCFDVYRRQFAEQMGFEFPLSATEERQMWQQVSRLMIYRSAGALDRLDAFRASAHGEEAEQQEVADIVGVVFEEEP